MTEVQGLAYEDNSGVLRMQLRQEPTAAQSAAGLPGSVVPKSSIISASLTIRDAIDETVINSRLNEDVLAKIDTDGLFEMLLDEEDFVINHTDAPEEIHVAILTVTFTGRLGTMKLVRPANIHVKNLDFTQ